MTRDMETKQSAVPSPDSPFSKKRLTWAEPRIFRRRERTGSWKLVFGIIGLTAGVALVFLCVANWFDGGAEVTWKLLIAVGAITMLCIVVWGCIHLMQIMVKITDKAIVVWDLGDTPTIYRFGSIDHCEIYHKNVGGRPIDVLVLELKNGDRETLGVAPTVSASALRSALEQRQVHVFMRTDSLSGDVLTGEKKSPYLNQTGIQPDHNEFSVLIECLSKDGLADEARRLNTLVNETAWTTGTEFLGELGLAIKMMRRPVRRYGSAKTKTALRLAAKVVRRT